MGLIWRRTKRLDEDTDLNVSKSVATLSRRVGRRLRPSSRGGGSFPARLRAVVAVWTAPLSNDANLRTM